MSLKTCVAVLTAINLVACNGFEDAEKTDITGNRDVVGNAEFTLSATCPDTLKTIAGNSAVVDGKNVFTLTGDECNYDAVLTPTDLAAWEMLTVQIPLVQGSNDPFPVQFVAVNQNPNQCIDMGPSTLACNDAVTDLGTKCAPVETAVGVLDYNGTSAGLPTCQAAVPLANNKLSALELQRAQACTDDPGIAEADAAITALTGKIGWALQVIQDAVALLAQPVGTLKITVRLEGVTDYSGVTVSVGSSPADNQNCTTDVAGICEMVRDAGLYGVVAEKDTFDTKSVTVAIVENGETEVNFYLPVSHPPLPDQIIPRDDFGLALGTNVNLAGAFKKADSNGNQVAIPDNEIVLEVTSGSSVTLNGLAVEADTGNTGGSNLTWCWTRGVAGVTIATCPTADKDVFTVVVY